MTSESQRTMRRRRKCFAVVPASLLAAGVLAGCGLFGTVPETPAPGDVVCPEIGTYDADAVHALIAYHREIRELDPAELQHARGAMGNPGDRPLEWMRQAMMLGDPRDATDLPRAIAFLGGVLASSRDDAIAVRSLARLLSGEFQERMRLEQLLSAESQERMRLERQLEHAGAQLKASHRTREELQEKLDALTEIERSLPARPSPDPEVPAEPTERRGAQ